MLASEEIKLFRLVVWRPATYTGLERLSNDDVTANQKKAAIETLHTDTHKRTSLQLAKLGVIDYALACMFI